MKIIPAIDLKDNKCVRLTKGKDDTSEIFGVGYSWLVGSSSGVRLEYTTAKYDMDGVDTDMDGLTLSVAARF